MSPRPKKKNQYEGVKVEKANVMRFLSSMKKYIPPIIVASVLAIAAVVVEIISPQYLKMLTDEITNHPALEPIDMGRVGELGVILIIFYVLFAALTYIASFIYTTVSQRYANYLRKEISRKINVLPLSYFDTHTTGDTLSRITTDVDNISGVLDQTINSLISSVMLLIGSVVAMFITSWQMALVAIASLPLLIVFIGIDMKFAAPHFKARQDQLGDIAGVTEENFSGQTVTQAFNASGRVQEKFDEQNKKLGHTMFVAQIFGGLMMPLAQFISNVSYIAVLLVGGLMIASKDPNVTFGTLTAFIVYVRLFQNPLTQMAQAANNLQTVGAASQRIFEFLFAEEMAEDKVKERVFPLVDGKSQVRGEIEFRNVSFSYDSSREIIHDFSAKIKPGMKVAIVGPTGAGKTTMVNLLMRFYEISGGDILIDGVSIKDMSKEEIHTMFGMVLQDTWVFEGSLRENLVYNTEGIDDEKVNDAVKKAHLSHFVKTISGGLDHEISDKSSLSGGQRQMITIARAMIENSPMLILDEATSNVDTRSEELIQESMDALSKGKTSFVIAHRLSTIKNSDLILVMRDGNVVEQGSHDELMSKGGFYASLYNSQFAFE